MNLKDCLNQDLTRYESIPFWSWNDELEPDEPPPDILMR